VVSFPLAFPPISYMHSSVSIRATFPAHLILLDLVILIILGEEYSVVKKVRLFPCVYYVRRTEFSWETLVIKIYPRHYSFQRFDSCSPVYHRRFGGRCCLNIVTCRLISRQRTKYEHATMERVLEVFSMWSAPCPVLGNGPIKTYSDNRRVVFYVVRSTSSAG
jgi:hypothetical protein